MPTRKRGGNSNNNDNNDNNNNNNANSNKANYYRKSRKNRINLSQPLPVSKTAAFCSNCGSKLPSGAINFCPFCGTRVQTSASMAPKAAMTPKASMATKTPITAKAVHPLAMPARKGVHFGKDVFSNNLASVVATRPNAPVVVKPVGKTITASEAVAAFGILPMDSMSVTVRKINMLLDELKDSKSVWAGKKFNNNTNNDNSANNYSRKSSSYALSSENIRDLETEYERALIELFTLLVENPAYVKEALKKSDSEPSKQNMIRSHALALDAIKTLNRIGFTTMVRRKLFAVVNKFMEMYYP